MRTIACIPLLCVALIGAGVVAGCGRQEAARPLTADAFTERRTGAGPTSVVEPVDESGPLDYDQRVDLDRPAEADANAGSASEPARDVPKAIEQAVAPAGTGARPIAEPAAKAPNPRAKPPAQPAPGAGQFQLVGTVLADINGTPIYADKVLNVLESALEAEARKREPEPFQAVAADLINRQVGEFINAELEFAMAQRKLEPRWEATARSAAMQWRLEEITSAGGSEELARRKWEAEGYDFDERVHEQYRTSMRQLYYAKKEAPKIQVRQRDIRDYYEANRDKEFATQGSYRVRLIKFAVTGKPGATRAESLSKALTMHRRITEGGEDFAKLASRQDEKRFADPVMFDEGAFAIEEIEQAAAKLEPGKVSEIIEAKDAPGRTEGFYLVKLEERTQGRVVPFEEAQDDILKKLRLQQFNAIRTQVQRSLREDAIIRLHPQMLDVAMAMAMQRYPQWAAAK